jgi:hypothetical protein
MSGPVGPAGTPIVELELSDPSELRSLRTWLERIPGAEVQQTAGTPAPGEQGASDWLTLLASSGGVIAVAIRTLPEFLRSRRSDLSVTVKVDGREYVVSATNVDEVLPAIQKILDA